MKVFLIGMPGSGKTYLGAQIATSMGLTFIDLDIKIVEHCEKEINQIFASEGEAYFREVEARLLRDISNKQDDFLLSTGGGVPCFHDNMRYIKSQGMSIFLNVSPAAIARRLLEKGVEDRPLLKEKREHLEVEITQKLAQRKKYYQQADIIITGDHIQVEDVVKKISN